MFFVCLALLTFGFPSSPPRPLPLPLSAVAQQGFGARLRVQAVPAAHRVGAAAQKLQVRLLITSKTPAPPTEKQLSSQP